MKDQDMHELIVQAVNKGAPQSSEEEKKKLEEVLTQFFENEVPMKQALGISNLLMESIYNQAYQFYKIGQYEKASKVFFLLHFLAGTGKNADPRFTLGIAACSHMQKNYDKAITYYVANAMLDPRSPMPFYHAADCFLQKGDKASALTYLRLMMLRLENKPESTVLKERAERMIATLTKEVDGAAQEEAVAAKKK